VARVEAATSAMFGDVYPLLADLDRAVTRERWERLFDYRWRSDGDGLGYVLVERGAVVGFIATLFSHRSIDGRETRLCNTAHWVVRDEFRSEGLLLLAQTMQLKDCSLTNLTSSRKVSVMMQKLGYKLLEERVTLLFPAPALGWGHGAAPLITADHQVIGETLEPGDARIWTDHKDSNCAHVVVRDSDGSCYLVFTRKHRRFWGLSVPYCHVHYVGNRAVFLRHVGRVTRYFRRTFGAWFVAVDERLLGGVAVPFSITLRLPIPRYYRSAVLAPHQIDNLYTELVA